MADQKSQQPGQPHLRGGTEGGEASRAANVNLCAEGTPDATAASGGVHTGPASRHQPATGLADRPLEDERLHGGKTAADVLGYLKGLDFPAKKDAIVRAARRNGAPDDVLGSLHVLTATEYADADSLLRDYPRLPAGESPMYPTAGGRHLPGRTVEQPGTGAKPRGSPQTDPTNPYTQESTGVWTAAEQNSERREKEPGLTERDREERHPTY